MYEDGVKDDANEEDEEEFSCMSNLKRQKIIHDTQNMSHFMRAQSTSMDLELSKKNFNGFGHQELE